MAHLERMLVPKAVLFAYLTPWGQDVGGIGLGSSVKCSSTAVSLPQTSHSLN